jgi:cytochrome P450
MTSELPPGPRAPRMVQSFNWMRQPTAVMESGRKRYGEVWTLRLVAHTTFVLVSDPELIKGILTAEPGLLHAGEANAMIGPAMLGETSVLLLDDEPHAEKRRLLRPPFQPDHVHQYADTILRLTEEEIDSWPLHEPLELLPRMQSITIQAIMSLIFGVTGGPAQERLHARIKGLFAWAANPLHMAKIHIANKKQSELPKDFLAVRDPFDAVLFEEIKRARQDPGLEQRADVLAMMLKTSHDDGSPMSDKELRDQLVTMLIQGHQTTAGALAWALERLMRNPQAYERLREEAQTPGEEYIDAVFKETLRARPPLFMIPRKVARQPYQLGNFTIPVGEVVAPSIYMLHHRQELYPDPYSFRPERFLEERDDKYTFIPFGGGDRHCLGRSFATAEFKEVLRTIMQRVRLSAPDASDEKIVRRGILLAPGAGARAVVQERVAPSTIGVAA